MYEHNACGYRSGLALCLSKVRSSRARCPATALIFLQRVHILTTTYHKTFIVHTHYVPWVGVRGGARDQNLELPKYCF